MEYTPTKANCGGALIYIENSMNYYQRRSKDLHKKEVDSICIEVINFAGKKMIASTNTPAWILLKFISQNYFK